MQLPKVHKVYFSEGVVRNTHNAQCFYAKVQFIGFGGMWSLYAVVAVGEIKWR
jgi:hypothetical protein